jgi:hypothetical protein
MTNGCRGRLQCRQPSRRRVGRRAAARAGTVGVGRGALRARFAFTPLRWPPAARATRVGGLPSALIRRVVVPGAQPRHVGEFDDHVALRRQGVLEALRGAAARELAAAPRGDQRRHVSAVLGVELRVGQLERGIEAAIVVSSAFGFSSTARRGRAARHARTARARRVATSAGRGARRGRRTGRDAAGTRRNGSSRSPCFVVLRRVDAGLHNEPRRVSDHRTRAETTPKSSKTTRHRQCPASCSAPSCSIPNAPH